MPAATAGRRTARLVALVQFAAAALIFRVAGFYRVMDADEGHFLSAIRCVFNGLRPQQDFFYQQTPLFPYPYALAMKLFGYGYETCLWVSVLCGAGLAVVTASWFARRCGAAWAGWIGWLLIVTNAPILFWTPTVKNHAMPLFFGALALWAAAHRPRARRDAFWWGALSGFAALWSVGTRLPAAPFAGAAFVWLLLRAVVRPRPAGAWRGMLGFVVGCMPPLLLALRSVFPDPWVFHFDILGFHAIRSGRAGTFGTWETISKQLTALANQVQFPAIVLMALFSGVCIALSARFAARAATLPSVAPRGVTRDENAEPAPGIARLPAGRGVELGLTLAGIIAGLAALLPAQTFHQYFMVPLLFFVWATAPTWAALARTGGRRGFAQVCIPLAAYGAFFGHHIEMIFPREWGLAQVRELSEELRRVTNAGDVVFSSWQGFTFMADRNDLPGNENFNARTVTPRLSLEECRRLKIATDLDLFESLVLRAEPKAIVIGFFTGPTGNKPFYRSTLYTRVAADPRNPRVTRNVIRPEIERNYQLLRVMGDHQLWVKRQ